MFRTYTDHPAVKLSLIVATSENDVIGNKNSLPWHLPADLLHFKKITMGHPVLMGRKTFESIGKPLTGRTNIIITRQEGYEKPGCITAQSIDEAINLCMEEDEVFIIGGADIIAQSLDRVEKVYLTRIHEAFDGDTFLPPFLPARWKESRREDRGPDEKNDYAFSFIELERIS